LWLNLLFFSKFSHKRKSGVTQGGKEMTAKKGHHSPEAVHKKGRQFLGRKIA